MASLQILKSSLCPVSISQSSFSRNSFCAVSRSNSSKRTLRLGNHRRHYCVSRWFRVYCAAQDGDNQAKGEEPTESLFMKELKRRGMSPTSLLEGYQADDDEIRDGNEGRDPSKRNVALSGFDRNLLNQRERSMALNSEGLEGLIPRAKLLLTIGGTLFLGFWPLIVLTGAFFSALYLYFGADFVHDASKTPISPPEYVDPYSLLEDERISQIAPPVN